MNLQGNNIYGWLKSVAVMAEKLVIVSPFFTVNSEISNLVDPIPRLKILIG